ncbi:hypothetical protein PV10_04294 [Exophiala mesophila]|uniref:RNA-dependent RNA polymerase n=1 Tax=Exophiala mesophila TaxID=212818 RepID=A0A0D1ZH04_EXOME|nr:uncharacterized protein PV10_04294 [Exophiala mesophila]KIV93049.1 hypothetical protein PV10_04294 [Exophiala mesophila]
MSIPVTPPKIGQMVDNAISRLNGRLDLRLPRLHGQDADPSREDESVSRKCSSLIRYLCYKTDSINGIMDQFDTEILQLFSDWKWKPLQTPGTLPALSITKSAINRDLTQQYGSGMVKLSKNDRKRALEYLHRMLLEEYNLTQLSDSYTRTLGPSDLSPTAPSSQFSFQTADEILDASSVAAPSTPETMKPTTDEPTLKYRDGQSSKRTMSSLKSSTKRQQTISQFFAPRTDDTFSHPIPQPISFTTEASSRQSAIFSDVDQRRDSLSCSDTSFEPSTSDFKEEFWPTQEYKEFDELMQHEISRQIHGQIPLPAASSPPAPAPTSCDVNDAQAKPLLKRHELPNVGENFILAYEIERLASDFNMTPTEFYSHFNHDPSSLTPDNFWLQVKEVRSKYEGLPFPTRSPLQDWTGLEERGAGKPENSITFSGSLEWSSSKDPTLFKLRLSPIQKDKSCRFYRKFGSDRFLVLSVPILSEPPGEKHHDRICNMLATESLEIAGRHWRVFFVAHEKAKKKRKPKDNERFYERFNGRLKIHLFAEHGCGIAPDCLPDLSHVNPAAHSKISVEDMIEWHMPLNDNLSSTDLKLFSRIHLGLSKTTPTVTLQPHEFVYTPDPPGKPVMNDGCALMSLDYANAVWKAFGGSDPLPCAFQGRIGGAKGLWLVDYTNKYNDKDNPVSERGFWIEVSDSQLKIKPHPRDRPESDDSQRTFELVKHSSNASKGHLNTQLINILEDRGSGHVREVLARRLLEDISSVTSTLSQAMNSPTGLLLWLNEFFQGRPSGRLIGCFPADRAEQCSMLLGSGFKPRENSMIVDAVKAILDNYTKSYVEKLWISLPFSTTVFCAPDPTGLLRPNEVYLGFSEANIDPRSGGSQNALNNIDVLVARNPAYLSSDMQLRRAVSYQELLNYRDIILFSTQGDTPTASLLSGGDYDGDMVTVIWDPEIVDSFHNISKTDLPSEKQLGMVNKSRALQDIFVSGKPQAYSFSDFMKGCIKFNSTSSLMGQCSSEHEKLIYSLSLSAMPEYSVLSQTGPVKLAALAGYLVDQSKQGWELPYWPTFRREACGQFLLESPAYKSPGQHKSRNYSNIIDHLMFNVAGPHVKKVATDFQKFTSEFTYDSSLSAEWKNMTELAGGKGNKKPRDTVLYGLLFGDGGLQPSVEALSAHAEKILAPTNSFTANGSITSSSFAANHTAIFEQFQAILPNDKNDRLWHEHQWHGPHSQWSRLKASYLYFLRYSKGQHRPWIWYVAGRQLCELKAMQEKDSHMMRDLVLQLMKFDAKHAKRVDEERQDTGDDGVNQEMTE